MNNKIWLSKPDMGGKELEYVLEAFRDNWVAPVGPHLNRFEDMIKAYTNSTDVVALGSGTAALHLALIALGVSTGDYVLCQSMTFAASANPIIYQGATPVFIDSENETWNICPQALEDSIKKLSTRGITPKAIIAVDLYGMPAKWNDITTLAKKYEIPVIEDAAEALGSSYNGKPCGAFGDIGVLSFNGNKIITTGGGGAMLSSNPDYVQHARFLSTQAKDDAPHYQHSQLGYNYRLSNISAAIGVGQMEVIDDRVLKRRQIFQRYVSYFSDWNRKGFDIRFQEEAEGLLSNRWLTSIIINPSTNNGLTRERIRIRLNEDNIDSRPLWKPMHLQPYYENREYFGGSVSQDLFDMGLCLPSTSSIVEAELRRIFNSLDNIFSEHL